jgi:hypothetical protein
VAAPSLKEQLSQLSQMILDFIYERIKNSPSVSTPDYFADDGKHFLRDMRQHGQEASALSAYERETLEIYEYKYQKTVASIIDSLKDLGLDSSELDRYVSGLVSETDPDRAGIVIPVTERVKQIGKQIGTLADRVSES